MSWLDGVNLLSETVIVIVLIYFILKYVARKIVIKASTFNILWTHKLLDPIFEYVNHFRIKQNKNSWIVLLNKVDVIKGFLSYILVWNHNSFWGLFLVQRLAALPFTEFLSSCIGYSIQDYTVGNNCSCMSEQVLLSAVCGVSAMAVFLRRKRAGVQFNESTGYWRSLRLCPLEKFGFCSY